MGTIPERRKTVSHGTSDFGRIHETLAHHDASLGDLDRRMHGVERGIHSLQTEVTKGFGDITSKLVGLESSKGPGFGKISAVALTVVSTVALLCGGIIWFVSSIVAPDTTKLEQMNSHQNAFIEKFDADREAELARLRQARERREEERMRRLEERLGWVPQEITRGP
jgi:hypothetical protein